ncbi:MAG: hypothetical protein IKL10_06595 [Clostridia bacterium]|nr:hypothetical protein [Clostridia bacterium]
MRESSKAALGGIVSALAIVIMLSTYISPLLVYTAPPFAGLLLLLIVNELGYKWSVGTYVSISLLSIFLIADKESAVFFTMFFGYFPILSVFFENRIKNKILRYIIKLKIFDISCFLSIMICIYVFGISYDDLTQDGLIFTIAFILLMNVLFVVYDILVVRLQQLYLIKFKKRFRKLFNIKN